MKLLQSLLLPALVVAASAAPEATVYLFQGKDSQESSNTPTLSPEQARLVFAQRLGTSQYHGLGDASEGTISYINQFGGREESLFQDAVGDKAAELVVIVEGVSSNVAASLSNAWSSYQPAFKISGAPSMKANKMLVSDLRQQLGVEERCKLEELDSAINPLDSSCWNGRSKVIQFDMGSEKAVNNFMAAQRKLVNFAKNRDMNVMVVLMPESASVDSKNPYGLYEKAIHNHMVKSRREPTEAPITEKLSPYKSMQVKSTNNSTNMTSRPVRGVLPACFSSRDECEALTSSCSGRGECYKKYSNIGSKGGCFTCGCRATNETFTFQNTTRRTISYWGGAACQKKDVSSPFWLISIFTIGMVATVSWGIGLMFSIGEEKLPGVIGAGVSSKTK